MKNLRFKIQELNEKVFIRSSESVKAGFTLIELLIVIAIIGVLATLLLANFIGVRQRARDGKRKSDINQVQAALEQYRADTGTYPNTLYSVANGDGTYSLTNNSVTYMKTIPVDPLGTGAGFGTNGQYYYFSNGTSYYIVGCLENSADSQGVAASSSNFTSSGAANTCTYNVAANKYFVVTNP